ncbi:hypothetical protein J437_LFUL000187 [Ladona fulva]|uniref:Tubulin-specific chaperone D n=1 Tax=Ladona fulva TaxID=123851 RepID=A0A8K0P0R9_LADFU|nr:hypothetical protein J437_LFUL000187 [Ladona fulva]
MIEIKENDTLDGGEDIGISCVREMFTEFPEVMKLIENVEVNCKRSNTAEVAYERYSKILDEYQEQPHLLDPHLDTMLTALVKIVKDCEEVDDLAHYCFKYIYFITKVRGHKVVVRHLPHEVNDLEKILKMLEAQNPTDINTWCSRYVLLLWLSIIVMIPFHMSRIDSFTRQEGERKSIIDRILDVCKKFIIAGDSCKNAAIFLASRFFIRADVRQEHLDGFLDWCCVELTDMESGWKGLEPVASILKHGKREDLLPYAPKLLRWNLDSGFRSSKNALIRKFSIKVVQRIARVATWRYKRGNRSLATNLNSTGGKNENLKASGEEMDEDDDVEASAQLTCLISNACL